MDKVREQLSPHPAEPPEYHRRGDGERPIRGIVGSSRPIHDAVGKVTGHLRYAGDMQLPNMAHAALVTSTVPHGLVLSVDAAAALAVPGVLAVLNCFNTTGELFNRYRSIKGQKTIAQEAVFNRHARFVGDRVACVVAETPEAARLAAAKVAVEYEEYPASFSVEDPLAGRIDQVHAEGAVYDGIFLEVGQSQSPEPGDLQLETETRLARINHVAMEPHVCVADFDPGTGELTLWSPNQSVHGIRTVVADLFGLAYSRVRVIKTTMGGSFGGKQEWMTEPVAAAAALKLKRPVKLALSREQVFASTICRAPMHLKIKGLFSGEGQLRSLAADNTLDAGAYLGNSFDYCNALSKKFFRCYKYPHLKYTGRAVITNTPVSGAFRGWTSPELAVALEHHLNMAARKLNIDPVDLRLKNAARPGDVDPILEISLGDTRLADCLERGREIFGWDRKKTDAAAFNASQSRYRRGIGVASGGHLNGYFPRIADFAEANMRMAEDGSVTVGVSLHDHGCGTVTAFRMIVAEVLGIDESLVRIGEGDTAVTPFDYGCYSSRTIYVLGRAARDCAALLLERLKKAAAEVSGINESELLTANGFITSRTDPSFGLAYAEAVRASRSRLREDISVATQYVSRSNPGVTGAHFAEVEVDTATGLTRIINYAAVHDIGQAVNRGLCLAQTQGAVLMGGGAALYEQVSVDSAGRPVSSLKDYHLINAWDAPDIKVDFIERGGTDGPFGAKSIGEVCHVPVAAAVAGAVNEALDTDCCRLPLNSDRVIELLREKGYRYEIEL